ncbi:cobalamin biosynthesis protein [Lachnospiraceae bacterium 29-84]
MQAAIIGFTDNGKKLAGLVKEKLEATGRCACPKLGRDEGESLTEWTRQAFSQAGLIIFIGAAGIAVRAIAPFVCDKFTDPAVLVLDEQGNYVIPLLSGHVGGGNAWAIYLAKAICAVPVVTTATDLYGKFAVDVFAVGQGLVLSDRVLAKAISAAILRGEPIGFSCEAPVVGTLPKDLVWNRKEEPEKPGCETPIPGVQKDCPVRYQISVGIHKDRKARDTLFLSPKAVVLGIGCKKGKTLAEIEAFAQKVLEEEGIAWESICCLASVDRKANEAGILEFCRKQTIPFHTFTVEQLKHAPGDYTDSGFVEGIVGIGNVCERAAMSAAIELQRSVWDTKKEQIPRLIRQKTAENGITIALAELAWNIRF